MWKRIDRGGRVLVASVLVLAATWPSQASEIGEAIEFGRLAPYRGKALTESRLQRKVTVLSLWASWCEICKGQLAEMESALAEVKDQKDLQIAFVSLDQNQDEALAFFKKHTSDEWTKESLYFDPDLTMADALEVQDFPMTVVIDRQGKIGFMQNGFVPGKGQTETLLYEIKQYLSLK